MPLFRRVQPPFGLKTLQKDSSCVLIQDPSAIWGGSDHLARRNLLTYSEDLSNAAWSKSYSAATSTTITATATSQFHYVYRGDNEVERLWVVKIGLKRNNNDWVFVGITNAALTYFNLATGGFGTIGAGTSASATARSDGGWDIVLTSTQATAGRVPIGLASGNGGGSFSAAGTEKVDVLYAQIALASTTDQSYQRVTDWTTEQYAWAAQKNVPWLRRNRLINTATLSTQTVTAVTATPLTVSFTGTGTITFSTAYSGSLVGTGAGDRVTATFTPSAGNLVCTVSGSVTLAQCEVGSTATPYQEVGASWAATYTALALAAGYPISLYSDRAGTTATYGPDDPVGKLLDLSGDNNHATAPSDAARPNLRLDGNGKWYLDRDTTDDDLQITWPTNLTTTGVIYTATGDYTTKDSGLTLSGLTSYKFPQRPSGDYGRIVMAAESKYDAKIIKYLDQKRGRSYLLGPELVDTLNTAAAWTSYTTDTVADDSGYVKCTYVSDVNGMYSFLRATSGLSADLVVGKTYLVTFVSKVSVGGSVVVSLYDGVTTLPVMTATATYDYPMSYMFRALSATGAFLTVGSFGSGESFWVKSISVKELML